MKKLSLLFFAVVLGLAVQSRAYAEPTTPKDLIMSTVDDVRDTCKKDEGKVPAEELDKHLRQIIAPVFDFEEMSRRSLGANWSSATADQQKEFVSVFSELLAHTYLKRIRDNVLTSTITVTNDAKKSDGTAEVHTNTKSDEDTTKIIYRLHQVEGHWRIYDVVVENVGLVSNYRGEFAGIVRREGMDGLLKRLREKELT